MQAKADEFDVFSKAKRKKPHRTLYFGQAEQDLINAAHDGLRFLRQMACSHSALAAENLFLRKQLAFYQEHKIRPRRLSNAAHFSLLLWSRLFDWQAGVLMG